MVVIPAASDQLFGVRHLCAEHILAVSTRTCLVHLICARCTATCTPDLFLGIRCGDSARLTGKPAEETTCQVLDLERAKPRTADHCVPTKLFDIHFPANREQLHVVRYRGVGNVDLRQVYGRLRSKLTRPDIGPVVRTDGALHGWTPTSAQVLMS